MSAVTISFCLNLILIEDNNSSNWYQQQSREKVGSSVVNSGLYRILGKV